MQQLSDVLKRNSQSPHPKRCLIVTESLFSMSGTTAPLDELAALADHFEALLIVDDAHAFGALGPKGCGLATHPRIDCVVGTFGKAAGSFGAYIACCQTIYDYLVQRLAGAIYSTALPPAVLGAVDVALDIIPQLDVQRTSLAALAAQLRQELSLRGVDSNTSQHHIIPIYRTTPKSASSLAEYLRTCGFYAPAIRPPTVAPDSSLVRLSCSIHHTPDHIQAIAAAIDNAKAMP
jgi:8-amino-7-oxononanoate synthase